MNDHSLQFATYYAKIVILAIIVSGGLQFAQAWVAPATAPPGGNVAGPLTTGAGNQTKLSGDISIADGGSLYVGGTVAGNSMFAGTEVISPAITVTSEICLNGDCVTKWPWK